MFQPLGRNIEFVRNLSSNTTIVLSNIDLSQYSAFRLSLTNDSQVGGDSVERLLLIVRLYFSHNEHNI
jgi:hypothetical protein